MNKTCNHCKESKPLADFFIQNSQQWQGSSEYCKTCHAAGLIKYGYGSYGLKYKTPNFRSE